MQLSNFLLFAVLFFIVPFLVFLFPSSSYVHECWCDWSCKVWSSKEKNWLICICLFMSCQVHFKTIKMKTFYLFCFFNEMFIWSWNVFCHIWSHFSVPFTSYWSLLYPILWLLWSLKLHCDIMEWYYYVINTYAHCNVCEGNSIFEFKKKYCVL